MIQLSRLALLVARIGRSSGPQRSCLLARPRTIDLPMEVRATHEEHLCAPSANQSKQTDFVFHPPSRGKTKWTTEPNGSTVLNVRAIRLTGDPGSSESGSPSFRRYPGLRCHAQPRDFLHPRPPATLSWSNFLGSGWPSTRAYSRLSLGASCIATEVPAARTQRGNTEGLRLLPRTRCARIAHVPRARAW